MSGRPGALIPALCLGLALVAALPAAGAELLGSWRWDSEHEGHGGYSAIEVEADGMGATVISDRGRIVRVTFSRGAGGKIDGLSAPPPTPLAEPKRLRGGLDAEGLAVAPDGTMWVSLEGVDLGLLRYETPDAEPTAFPPPREVKGFARNRRLEALAIAPDGALWGVPETSTQGGFRVHIFRDGKWSFGPLLPASDRFLPVGLDFDDQGRLYLLGRDLAGFYGFRSQVRRFTLDAETVTVEEELFSTEPGFHDNLEGLSVWRDPGSKLRLTMISDDNFFALQKTEIVEYVLPD